MPQPLIHLERESFSGQDTRAPVARTTATSTLSSFLAHSLVAASYARRPATPHIDGTDSAESGTGGDHPDRGPGAGRPLAAYDRAAAGAGARGRHRATPRPPRPTTGAAPRRAGARRCCSRLIGDSPCCSAPLRRARCARRSPPGADRRSDRYPGDSARASCQSRASRRICAGKSPETGW